LKKTILMTGARGSIGSILRKALMDTYTIRAMSRHPIPGVDSITADLSDMPALRAACRGVDSVIHLAANGSQWAPWDDVLHSNIIGTYNIFEAASQAGAKQVIYASSNHALGTYDLEAAPEIYRSGMPLLDHLVPVRPDSYYGVSKCFAEALGRYYADQRGLHVLSLRIGYVSDDDKPFPWRSPESLERLAAIWLSHRDLVQLVEKSLEAEHVPFDIFYGISDNQPHFYDLTHAREIIGYVPQDGAVVSEARAAMEERAGD